MALIMTLVVGLFILLGGLIIIFTKNNKKVVDFAISLGFGVLASLVIFELIPESIELLETKFSVLVTIILMLVLIFLGIGILKLLDHFVPDHDTHDKDNLMHVGVMTSIALFIHNFLEGMTVYTAFNSSFNLGIMLALGVALHNIPLGMSITSFFYKKKSKGRAITMALIVSLATFFGGLVALIFSGTFLSDVSLGIILAITLGMIIYIVIFELLPHIMNNKDKKMTIIGVLLGIIVLMISIFLE